MTKKKIFKRPAIGRIHFHMSTTSAQKVLTKIGPILTEKLSVLLGGAKIVHRVMACKAKPGHFRLLFDAPLGTKLPKTVDILPVVGKEKVLRVVTFPLEAFSVEIYNFAMKYWLFFGFSKISPNGENLLLRFNGTEQQIGVLRAVAKRQGIQVQELSSPKVGDKKPGIYLVIRLQKIKKKLATPRVKKARRSKPAPDLTRQSISSGLLSLPKEDQMNIVSSALEAMSDADRLKMISQALPPGVGLYDTNSPFKQNGVGMVVNKLVFEEEG